MNRNDTTMNNAQMADALDRIAVLLETRETNPLRVDAYHRTAEIIDGIEPSRLVRNREDLMRAIADRPFGEEVAEVVRDLFSRSRSEFLERLEAEPGPKEILQRIPGVGPVLAARIHSRLGVETLKELERAAQDGRLDAVAGIARGKADAIREELREILSNSGQVPGIGTELPPPPPVELLLALDAEYRERAEAGELDVVVPRQFNPKQQPWLPVWRARRDGWKFTAAYTNTRRAHEERRVRDWVTIWFEKDGAEDSSTVVTSRTATLRGERVVRGREAECRQLYRGRSWSVA
jgi:hypothetical protein